MESQCGRLAKLRDLSRIPGGNGLFLKEEQLFRRIFRLLFSPSDQKKHVFKLLVGDEENPNLPFRRHEAADVAGEFRRMRTGFAEARVDRILKHHESVGAQCLAEVLILPLPLLGRHRQVEHCEEIGRAHV